MRIQKIAKATITGALALALSSAPAFAAVNDTAVINSGGNTTVNSNATTNSSTAVSNTNSATVSQDVHSSANTGGNDASGNINLGGVGGAIHTGAAAVNTNLGVDVNHNATAIAGTSEGTANHFDVVNTGYGADLNANATTNTTTAVANSNTANVAQSAWGKANTGKNDANSNIGGGEIVTGGAGVGTTLGVMANHNATGIGGGAGSLTQGGLLNDTSVTNTGADARVNSNSTLNSVIGVTNANSLYATQDIGAKSNTGKNDANSNIGGGDIFTGPAAVGTGATVDANHNATGISSWGAGGLGLNVADIINTGYGLDTNTNATENTVQSVGNSNDLWSYQTTWTHTNSGKNATDYNIGGGLVGTNGAGVTTGLGLTGNQSFTGIGWWGDMLGWLSM